MVEKPTYSDLERKINKLEKEVHDYMHKEREFREERRLIDRSHMRRAISLLKINEELSIEIKELKNAKKEGR